MKWIRQLVILILILSTVSLALDYWRGRHITAQAIPAAQLLSAEGIPLEVSALSYEKPVVLYFWATWCPICDVVTPTIHQAAGYPEVVTVFSIAMRSGTQPQLTQYMATHYPKLSVYADETGRLSEAWQVTATPTVLLLVNGEITSVTIGLLTPPGLWLRLFYLQAIYY